MPLYGRHNLVPLHVILPVAHPVITVECVMRGERRCKRHVVRGFRAMDRVVSWQHPVQVVLWVHRAEERVLAFHRALQAVPLQDSPAPLRFVVTPEGLLCSLLAVLAIAQEDFVSRVDRVGVPDPRGVWVPLAVRGLPVARVLQQAAPDLPGAPARVGVQGVLVQRVPAVAQDLPAAPGRPDPQALRGRQVARVLLDPPEAPARVLLPEFLPVLLPAAARPMSLPLLPL